MLDSLLSYTVLYKLMISILMTVFISILLQSDSFHKGEDQGPSFQRLIIDIENLNLGRKFCSLFLCPFVDSFLFISFTILYFLF